jgi:Tfp pilus assembly protein PilF
MTRLIGIAILAVCALIAIGAEPAAAAAKQKKPAVTKTAGKAKAHSHKRKTSASPAKKTAMRKQAAKPKKKSSVTKSSRVKSASAKKRKHASAKHTVASTSTKRKHKNAAKQQHAAKRQKPVARREQPARIEPPLEDTYLLGFTDDPAAHFSKLPAAPDQDLRTEALLDSATDALSDGRQDEGMATLRKILDQDARQVRARALLAGALTQSHRNSEAASMLKEGLVFTPDDATLTRLYARVLVDMGDSQGALTTLDRIPADQADAGHHAFVAALKQKLGQHRLAVAAYERAIVAGCPANCWVGMGISLEALGRKSEASAAFTRAAQAPALEAPMRHYAQTRLTLLSGSAD